ncbi:peptide/nickel transport system substrate-binding protein [Microcella alkaliphila]|uniref:Peptide/nickel transport system substrate-binding protein n=1 Tax=Microcella alkaliphila TaxID=279828 RepID=A0A4Q7TQP3_9MICO|nr:ABC transporter family substrate-binding protein [Microcella alkaliphila]RZT62380.1 peptide/nickel transport system substrate-binding protein [Microcella alkaliphila]
MRISRFGALTATVAASALVLSACSAPADQPSEVVEGSSVNVAWNQAFYTYNSNTSYGNATANANIVYMTSSAFNYYNNVPELVKDESFGTYELVTEDPQTVQYTINEGVQWSDGVPVDEADMLLAWVANSGVLNTPEFDPNEFTNPETGEFTEDYPTDVVYFDGAIGAGLENVTETPEIGDREITLVYDTPFVDWELAFGVGLPAHVVAQRALGIEDAQEAKDALVEAVQTNDAEALAALSNVWNTDWNFTELPTGDDANLLVVNGPYQISNFVADQFITLTANPNYVGDNAPQIEEITVRFIADPLAAVQALQNGDVDVIQPQATADVLTALESIDGITVNTGVGGTYEHLDLQFDQSKSGHFNDPLVREAFLKTIPRQQIVDTLIVPLNPDAEVRNSQLFVPGAEGYDDSVASNGMAERFGDVDIEGAAALLAEAGVENPEVCILYASNNPRRVNQFALIQQSANQAGFNVTDCGSETWGGLLGTPGAYDASLFGWQSTSLGVTNASANFRTGGINNLNFYSNEEVDALLTELDTALDPARQIEIQIELDGLLMADNYGLTIFQFPEVTAFSDRVTGVNPGPLSPTIFWNIWDWTPTEAASE